MAYKISADTGGTFIDVVVQDDLGAQFIGKALTTHDRVFTGLEQALAVAAEQVGRSNAELLADTDLFIYGTTRATNAIVTRNVAKTALVVTEGFADILVLKEGGKLDGADFSKPFPEPYIPRSRTYQAGERIDSEGQVVRALDEEQLRRDLIALREQRFEAVAVALLWSVVNPAHELRIAELIEELLPGIPYTLSHRVAPILREYRRASAASIDASLKPLMQAHFRELERDLRGAGYASEILVSSSLGGVLNISEVIESPIHTARSGPSMAPLAGVNYSRREGLGEDIIVADTGGTTFDVGIARDGVPTYSRDTWIGPRWEGDLLGIASVDIRSVGAGGGSIAWVDDGGLLRVGPQSAGSEPGPACYGRGGTEPTLSDAVTVLGYFDPEFFLGGRMTLDTEAAVSAVGGLADRLGVSIDEVAWGILILASESMVKAVHEITVAQGLNPQESTLVAGGGAAGINIMQIAKELGSERIVLPKIASVLSASGMHFADIKTEASEALLTNSAAFAEEAVDQALARINARLESFAEQFQDRYPDYEIEFAVEARYESQVWSIDVQLPTRDVVSDAGREQLFGAFHDLHERVLAVRDLGSNIEFLSWHGRLTVRLPHGEDRSESVTLSDATPAGNRNCYFGEIGRISTPIFKPESLHPGARITGPAIVEETTTTLVVFPGMSAEVTGSGNYLLRVDSEVAR
jgi:N-methylhydantoinase A